MIGRVARRPDRDLSKRGRGCAIGKPGNRWRGGRAEHPTPRQTLLLGQEAGRIELAGTEGTVGLMHVRAQHVLDDLLIRAPAIEYRLVALRDCRRGAVPKYTPAGPPARALL